MYENSTPISRFNPPRIGWTGLDDNMWMHIDARFIEVIKGKIKADYTHMEFDRKVGLCGAYNVKTRMRVGLLKKVLTAVGMEWGERIKIHRKEKERIRKVHRDCKKNHSISENELRN